MKSASPRYGRRVLLGAATILAVVAAGMQSGHFVQAEASAQMTGGDDSNAKAQSKEEVRRKVGEKEFLREHSDASGKPRPDLWRKGIEEQKQMQVAPYIGWHPKSADAKKADVTDKK